MFLKKREEEEELRRRNLPMPSRTSSKAPSLVCRYGLLDRDDQFRVEQLEERKIRTDSCKDYDVSGTLFSHSWEGSFDNIYRSEEVGFEL